MSTKPRKRNLFNELKKGIEEFSKFDEGKLTLKTSTVKALPKLEVTGAEIIKLRAKLNISRPVFAHALRINPRKLESWEQNRSRVSDEAATLIRLVEKDPTVLERIRRL